MATPNEYLESINITVKRIFESPHQEAHEEALKLLRTLDDELGSINDCIEEGGYND